MSLIGSLNVFICLADDDRNWLLKIRNDEGDTVVWDDSFKTAREALNEGMKVLNRGDKEA